MTKQERQDMINRIYEEMSDKTLSFWCRVSVFWLKHRVVNCENPKENDLQVTRYTNTKFKKNEYEIIWHPVMIWDVLDWIREKNKNSSIEESYINNEDVIRLRKEKRKPIEDQSDECVAFIHSLIPND